jgi:thiol-disulfide isomerase/thioredoxin
MRLVRACLILPFLLLTATAQEHTGEPSNEKAQKTFKQAWEYLNQRNQQSALDSFKKADKQDGGHCTVCQKQMVRYGIDLGDWKAAELGAEELIASAKSDRDTALAHYDLALVLMDEGLQKHKDEYFTRTHEECLKAMPSSLKFPDAVLLDGRALAQLHQDDAAKDRFEQYLKMKPGDDPNHQRVARYISRPELARARMAPPFAVTTTDGKVIAMDDLQGKVVLLDFWATWCEPCREAMPHIRNVAKKFQGQPLVVLSVSLDTDEQKWKAYVAKNEMTWPQYRDGGFTGPVAKMFGVTAIPHTFTIDADGVLQEEHVGDASIEGKLKKLLAQIRQGQSSDKTSK